MSVYYSDETLTLLLGDAREVLSTMDAGSVDCVVTSPPYYGLRDYEGNPDQIGHEETPQQYAAALVAVFNEVRRVLAKDGNVWLNLGDSYNSTSCESSVGSRTGRTAKVGATARDRQGRTYVPGLATKNLFGIPWRVALALQDAGWILRNAIVWHKPNAMPESVTDRLSTRYELLFLLTKSRRYHFDLDAIREPHAAKSVYQQEVARRRPHAPGKAGQLKPDGVARAHSGHLTGSRELSEKGANPGDVWSIATVPFKAAHFAAFPPELPRRCILAGCRPGGTVLDPFSGAGTTALAAQQLGRRAVGIDINAAYHDIALRRMADAPLPLESGGVA